MIVGYEKKSWVHHTGPKPLVIIGGGGLGREVVAIVADINDYAQERGLPAQWDLLGFIDDGSPDADLCARLGVEHLGSTEILPTLAPDTHYIIAIGSGSARAHIAALADAAGLAPAIIIHPDNSIGLLVDIGPGTLIAPGSRVSCNIVLGAHSVINANVEIGHDATVGDFATVMPCCAISGFVRLERESTVGANAVVNPGVRVGEGAYIGSGAAVTRDIADYTLAVGVPARPIKQLR